MAKSHKKEIKGFVPESEAPKSVAKKVPRSEEKQFSELVIKEIMVQKNVSREKAVEILKAHRS